MQLTVRSELEGQQPEKAGEKAYVTPFTRFAEAEISWMCTRRVLAVNDDGSAEIEETQEEFSTIHTRVGSGGAEETARLAEALRAALARWGEKRVLRYRESAAGQATGVSAFGVPLLDEAPPQLLTPWVLRALRPAQALPPRPVHFGESWQEPRSVQLPNWSDVRGSESGTWLEAADAPEPAVRLHVVQQIFGSVTGGADRPDAAGKAEGRFHGESLATLSLGDARLLLATRSAIREITWVLPPVEGLPERPRFRGRLSVQVRIEELR